jgi:hypothetical protein
VSEGVSCQEVEYDAKKVSEAIGIKRTAAPGWKGGSFDNPDNRSAVKHLLISGENQKRRK